MLNMGAQSLRHFDANIRRMLVEMHGKADALADYLNERGYEGRHVTTQDIVATLADWVAVIQAHHRT